ncbi:MAG: CsiV family protein [Pseudohongiellaceae bacterium]
MRIRLLQYFFLTNALTFSSAVVSQERWFKVELSIFSNENAADRLEEQWHAERTELSYPDGLRRLNKLSDLLLADNLLANSLNTLSSEDSENKQLTPEEVQAQIRAESIAAIGPSPATNGSGFKLFDFLREDFLQLLTSESDFQQTNRTLERSSDHRLLFHGLWRQAVVQPEQSIPVYIEGGLAYGDQHELQGSLTIRFNENEDRVVIDTNLWLTEFSIVQNQDGQWSLPTIPEEAQSSSTLDSDLSYYPIQIYHMEQSREMRSAEFHYLDHPAMGVVILVEPYEIPPAPLPTLGF